MISKCGFNRNTSRKVIYGPVRLNGGGFRPFATEQGVGQIQYLFKHWTSTLRLGLAMRITVSWAQTNTGVGWSLLDNVSTILPHFESEWLRVLRNFLHSINGKIRLDETYVPARQRVNDSYIMDHVLANEEFSKQDICRINYCRLYLQAVTVSDITNASGTWIFPGIQKGDTRQVTSTTTWHQTVQEKPDRASWKLWSKALSSFSTRGMLHNQLYGWILPPNEQRRKWQTYYDPTTDYLLKCNDKSYDVHYRCRQTFGYEPSATQQSISPKSYPVDARKTNTGWRIARLNAILTVPPPVVPSTFQEYCSSLEYWESQLLLNANLQFTPEEIIHQLSTKQFRACSDGSAIANQGTFGGVLALADKTRLAFGAGPVDGHDPQSFRSEGQGMLSVVCLLSRLKQWTKSSFPITGILATDNSGLIDRNHEQTKVRYPVPNQTFQSDWDVVEAIVTNVARAGINVIYKHVKGHQDKEKAYDDLPFLAQLNVDADKYAGEYQRQHGTYQPIIPLSPTRPIAIDLDGKTIHRHLKSAIRDAAHSQPLMNRLVARNGWTQLVPKMIDWEAHRLATTGAHRKRQSHFVKLCHDYLPAGKIAHRNNASHPHLCPLCKSPYEEHQHILQCPHPSREAWRTQLIKQISDKCTTLQTDPILTSILTNGLRSWLEVKPFDEGGIPFPYQHLLDDQLAIGWYHIFLARMSTQWAKLQTKHLKSNHIDIPGLSGHAWTKTICTTIMTLWLELWDQRNKDRHGVDSTQKSIQIRDQAIREITILYTYKNKVLQRGRIIFDQDLADHTNHDTKYIRQWINTHQTSILRSAKKAKTNAILNVRTLPTYFTQQRILDYDSS
jgi:hypothetical protein